MTTRAKRSAKPPKIEALISKHRELLKTLVRESLEVVLDGEMTKALGARPGERTATRTGYRALLQPEAGDADWEFRAAGAARPGGEVLHGAV